MAAFDSERNLVGRTAVLTMPIIETTWVEESFRFTRLPQRLFQWAEKTIGLSGWQTSFVLANDAKVIEHLEKYGYTLVEGVKVFAKRV
jgi:hypothetical protein